jgi:hypothetical protein
MDMCSGAVMDVSMSSPGGIGEGSAAEESVGRILQLSHLLTHSGDDEWVSSDDEEPGRLKAKRMNLNHLSRGTVESVHCFLI